MIRKISEYHQRVVVVVIIW